MHLTPSSYSAPKTQSTTANVLQTFAANKLSRVEASDANTGPKLTQSAAKDIRGVIDRHDNAITQIGAQQTQENATKNKNIFSAISGMTTAASYLLTWACAAAAGPAGVLAQPLLKSGLDAVTTSAGTFSAAQDKKFSAALGGFMDSLKQDFRAVSQVLHQLMARPGESFKKYFLSAEHAPQTHSFIGAMIGGLAGVAVLGPVGALIGLAVGNYVGQAVGRVLAKATAEKGTGPSWSTVMQQAITGGKSKIGSNERDALCEQIHQKEAALRSAIANTLSPKRYDEVVKIGQQVVDLAGILERGGHGNHTVNSSLGGFLSAPYRPGIPASTNITQLKRAAQIITLENAEYGQAAKQRIGKSSANTAAAVA